MSLSLTHWSRHGFDRVYVRGPAIAGKTFLSFSRGKLKVESDEYVDEAALLSTVRELADVAALPDAAAWPRIVTFAQQPARGRAVRSSDAGGAIAGSRASPVALTSGGHDLDITTIKIPGPVEFEVDHREPDALSALLAEAPNAQVTRCHLPLGDIRINGRILVERKTVADFEASVIDPTKRLFNQAERLGFEAETLVFLILEGDPYAQHRRMTMQQITGAFSYLSAIKGLSVLQVPDMTATAYTLAKIAQHDRHGLGYSLGLRSNKAASLLDARRYVLEGLPGVNAVLAERLLQRFGSVAAVFSASEADLRTVEGIGPKTARGIVELAGRA